MRIITLLFIIFTFHCYSQVNTEALRKNDLTNGVYNQVALSLGFNEGNSRYFQAKGDYRTDFKYDKNYGFLSISAEYKESGNEVIVSKGFAHLRYMYHISDYFEPEIFLQKEFNKFILLYDRMLAGLGGRFKLTELGSAGDSASRLYIYAGLGIMYEIEEYTIAAEDMFLFRNTNYISIAYSINPVVSIISVSYIQPALSNLSDFRFYNQSGISFVIVKNLNFTFNLSLRYDNIPYETLKKWDIEILNGISFSF